jgi:hypothetical protein
LVRDRDLRVPVDSHHAATLTLRAPPGASRILEGVRIPMSNPRTRMAAFAGTLALSLSLVAAPAVLAQDGPEATIEGLLGAIEAKNSEGMSAYFCAEFADQANALDFSAMTEGMPDSPEVQSLFDAIILDVEIASLEVLSQSDTEAIVELVASMTMDVDAEAMGPFVGVMLEMSGMPITDENVEMFTGLMLAEFEAESTDISEEITLVPGETMPWVICDELGADEIDETEGMVDEGMVDEGMDDEMSEDADGE